MGACVIINIANLVMKNSMFNL